MDQSNRRLKQLLLPIDILHSILRWQPDQLLSIPEIHEPSDCKIVNISFSPSRYCFVILFYHPSFDIVPLNTEPPNILYLMKSFALSPLVPDKPFSHLHPKSEELF